MFEPIRPTPTNPIFSDIAISLLLDVGGRSLQQRLGRWTMFLLAQTTHLLLAALNLPVNNQSVSTETPDTSRKAQQINQDARRYGTFAEIGAGQEVARWFFRAGSAAGTVAKTRSEEHTSELQSPYVISYAV